MGHKSAERRSPELSEIKHEVRGLSGRVGVLEHKVDSLEHKVDSLEHKVDSLEHKVDALDRKIDGVERRLDQKIDGVERRLDQKIDTVKTELMHHMAELATHTVEVVTKNMSAEFARHAQAMEENHRAQMRLIEEKYGDLPQDLRSTRAELEHHVADDSRHLPRQ